MFFHRRLLGLIGYPNDKLFLYGDDYEFSYRIISRQGEIILLLDSRIDDIDDSENKGMAVDEQNLFRMYYSNRNYVFFQKQLANSRLTFCLNYALYLLFLACKRRLRFPAKKEETHKISVMMEAIEDGYHGRLGEWKRMPESSLESTVHLA